jgi:hypothetical protein
MANHGTVPAQSTPYWESVGIFDQTSLALGGQGTYIPQDDDMENRGSIS